MTKSANRHGPEINPKRSLIACAITSIALSLGHLGARLVQLLLQSLKDDSSILFVMRFSIHTSLIICLY